MATPPPPAPLLPPPSGYTFGSNLPSAVVARAREVLNDSSFGYGDTSVQRVNGIDYIHRIEPHYDDHVGGVLKWHRGVTVYQPTGTSGSGGSGGSTAKTPAPSGGQEGSPPLIEYSEYDMAYEDEGEPPNLALAFIAGATIGFLAWRALAK